MLSSFRSCLRFADVCNWISRDSATMKACGSQLYFVSIYYMYGYLIPLIMFTKNDLMRRFCFPNDYTECKKSKYNYYGHLYMHHDCIVGVVSPWYF